MKGIDIFCTSEAATAIRLGMDHQPSSSSSSSSSTIHLGNSRAIDRHNPIIRDERRLGKSLNPSTSQAPPPPPISFKNQKTCAKESDQEIKKRKKKNKTAAKNNGSVLMQGNNNQLKKKDCIIDSSENDNKNISTTITTTTAATNSSNNNNRIPSIRKSWSCKNPGDFISPPTSSRYLLGDKAFLDVLSDFDPVLTLVPAQQSSSDQIRVLKPDGHDDYKESSSVCKPLPPPLTGSADQVVVLKVSLHCRGCERKMRKHISRMEGVTSFTIDFAAKKVTVVGDVTPLGVLASVSKVRSAQLWMPSAAVPLANKPPAVSSGHSGFINRCKQETVVKQGFN